jgi:hypothetical protein
MKKSKKSLRRTGKVKKTLSKIEFIESFFSSPTHYVCLKQR